MATQLQCWKWGILKPLSLPGMLGLPRAAWQSCSGQHFCSLPSNLVWRPLAISRFSFQFSMSMANSQPILMMVCMIQGAKKSLVPGESLVVLLHCCTSSSLRAWEVVSSWGALQSRDLCHLTEPGPGSLSHGFWQGEAVSCKLTRLVGPTEHLFAWAGEFSLQPWLVGVLCGIQDGWNMA